MASEWISISGKKIEVLEKFQKELGINKQTVNQVLALLVKEKEILCDDEECRMTIGTDKAESSCNMLSLMTVDYNYYINIRVATVFLLSVLIDNKFSLPITSAYLTCRGIKRLVEKIEENSGMKCILLEILRTSDKSGTEDILNDFRGECCNNNLSCCWRSENECRCTREAVKEVLDELTNIGILKKRGDIYQYDPIGAL